MARLFGLSLLAFAAGCASAEAPLPVLEIEVRARALAPGEPVRIEIASTAPLRTVSAEFLGRPVRFARLGPEEDGERYGGWAVVALDQAPGPAAIEVQAEDLLGRPVPATHAVSIASKEFPEERLRVSDRFVKPPPPDVQARIDREQARTKAIYATVREAPALLAPFVRPVPGEPTAIFGARRFFNDEPRSPHPGLDLRAAEGTPVHAAGPGVVALAADLYYSGNTVIVDHGGGLFTIYAHLSSLAVQDGQAIEAGALLGKSGSTGRVTGPHLHWGAKVGDVPFDPRALLDSALFR